MVAASRVTEGWSPGCVRASFVAHSSIRMLLSTGVRLESGYVDSIHSSVAL